MTNVGNIQAGAVGTAQVAARPTIQVVPPKGLPIVAAVVAFVIASMSRLRPFAWDRFFLVFWCALLAYVISAGMIGFAFVKDHVRGAPLAVVFVMLVIFALDVPLIIAFTVARYSSPAGHAGSLSDVSQRA
jgi:hypothetical protein